MKKNLTSVGFELTTSGLDLPMLCRLSNGGSGVSAVLALPAPKIIIVVISMVLRGSNTLCLSYPPNAWNRDVDGKAWEQILEGNSRRQSSSTERLATNS